MYKEIRQATGVSPGVVADQKREMGLLRSRTQKRWTTTPEPIIEAAREVLLRGRSIREVTQATGAPYSRVKRLRDELGLTKSRTPRSEQQPPQAPTPPAQDAAPTAPHPSDAYFLAIRDGILKGHAREQALEEHVATLQSRIAELDARNRELYDTLTQIRAQMSTWAGPAPIPHRNLSTGG